MRSGANGAMNTAKHRHLSCGVNYVCQVGFTFTFIFTFDRERKKTAPKSNPRNAWKPLLRATETDIPQKGLREDTEI